MPGPLAAEIAARLARALTVDAAELAGLLTQPPRPELGDYALPCFELAKKLRRSPKEIAAELAEGFSPDDVIEEARAAGPYVNVRVSTEALAREVLSGVRRAAAEGRAYAASREGEGRTVVVEYSSPNIAKPFGIGHLRSTVIGAALVRLYEAGGFNVVKLNYPGDWGTQFGVQLAKYARDGKENRLKSEGIGYLVSEYQNATAEIERSLHVLRPGEGRGVCYEYAGDQEVCQEGLNPPARSDRSIECQPSDSEGPLYQFNGESARHPLDRAAAREAFKKLEDGDEESCRLWKRFRDLSLEEFQRVYDLLGVEFDSFDGEAATRPLIPGAIGELERRGLLVESEGARVVELGLGENVPPAMIVKSDDATTYLARDLAEVLSRREKYHFDRCIYVVGRDQELHFRQLFRVLELMGLDWADACVHVPFGMIRFGGGKMRTRAGGTVGLENVLDRAFEEVGRVVESRTKGALLAGEEQDRASREVAVGAVVFADLSRRRIKDFDFDWETAFSLEGDSGPYLMYAHARACGIIAKAGREPPTEVDFSRLSSGPERALLFALGRYPDAVARAREENEPSVLGSHLLEIGRALNHFYNTCRVIGEERALEDARLLLAYCARAVLAEALGILGIRAPEAM
jgi:arginyl-tRNA synthetase